MFPTLPEGFKKGLWCPLQVSSRVHSHFTPSIVSALEQVFLVGWKEKKKIQIQLKASQVNLSGNRVTGRSASPGSVWGLWGWVYSWVSDRPACRKRGSPPTSRCELRKQSTANRLAPIHSIVSSDTKHWFSHTSPFILFYHLFWWHKTVSNSHWNHSWISKKEAVWEGEGVGGHMTDQATFWLRGSKVLETGKKIFE